MAAKKPRVKLGRTLTRIEVQCNQDFSDIESSVLLPPIAHNTPPTTPLSLPSLTTSTPNQTFMLQPAPLDLTIAHEAQRHTPPATPMDHYQLAALFPQQNQVNYESPIARDFASYSTDHMYSQADAEMNEELPNVYSLPTRPMYNTTLLSHMTQKEKLLHKQFLEKKIADIPMTRNYSRERTRQTSSQNESFDGTYEMHGQKRTQMRSINNQKSLQSRLKQKMFRATDSLTVLFLRERIAEYERRIEKLMKVCLNPHESDDLE